MTDQSGGQTPAGWYPDGSGQTRYWDGAAWTEHVAPPVAPEPVAPVAPQAPIAPAVTAHPEDPLAAQQAAFAAPVARTAASAEQPFYKRPVVIACLAVALLLVAGGAIFALNSGGDATTTAGAPGTTPTKAVPAAPAANSQSYTLSCQPSTFPVDNYPFVLTLTVTPSAAAGGPVEVSLSSIGSIKNTGPTIIQPDKYRFEASVTVNGQPLQLIGPKNTTTATGAPAKEAIFPPATQPLVAKATTPAPAAGAALSVLVTDLYFNNINNAPTGDDTLKNTFDARCNASPQPNTAPVPIGLAVPAPAGGAAPASATP